ncbi:hypothetical protein niasHT_005342 [Heterodera trifolii]|uniref:Uncharacterized protein n=1 Tax=Heterodera trifolii TaxID=157864 RepID=A0ABD2M0S0_9BILA
MFEQSESPFRELAEELTKFYVFSSEYLQQNRLEENSAMESDEEMGEENGKQQNDEIAAAAKAKRRALKTVAKKGIPPTDDAATEGETRTERRAKRRAQRSSLVEELRAEMGQAPEVVTDQQQTNAIRRRAEAQRRFEEAHFVRLSGGEQKRRRLNKASGDDSDLRHLLDFGRYRFRNGETTEEKTTTARQEFRTPKRHKGPKRNDKKRREKKKGGKRKGKARP